MRDTAGVAVVGCGAVSRKYFPTLRALPGIRVIACADIVPEKAAAAAAQLDVAALPLSEAIARDDVDIVLNLTVPAVHARISLAALDAGKHVYTEKPLAATLAAGRDVIDRAANCDLRVGCAPDTVLGTGIQTARRLIDEGAIGVPVAGSAFFLGGGPDNNHPNPAIFYQNGAGPLYDMGPYYLTSLVTLLGPIRQACGFGGIGRSPREVNAGRNAGTTIEVEVDTHVSASIQHDGGAISTLITSFDAAGGTSTPRIEVYGTTGTLVVPNPNGFSGSVLLGTPDSQDWRQIEPLAGYVNAARGIGVADLASAVRRGENHRAAGDLALHVLDAMESIRTACQSGSVVTLSTSCRRPRPVQLGDPVNEFAAINSTSGGPSE